MNLKCPICQSTLSAEEVNVTAAIGSCNSCNNTFSLSGSLSQSKAKKRITECNIFEYQSPEGLGL